MRGNSQVGAERHVSSSYRVCSSPRRWAGRIAIVVGLVVGPACGEAEGDGPLVRPVDWGAYCDARAELSCAGFDAAACEADETCALAMLRDEIEAPMLDCLLQGCDWRFESCLEQAGSPPMSELGESFQQSCLERVAGCTSDDYCSAGRLLSDGALAELSACLELGCDEMGTCMEDYWDNTVATCIAWG